MVTEVIVGLHGVAESMTGSKHRAEELEVEAAADPKAEAEAEAPLPVGSTVV